MFLQENDAFLHRPRVRGLLQIDDLCGLGRGIGKNSRSRPGMISRGKLSQINPNVLSGIKMDPVDVERERSHVRYRYFLPIGTPAFLVT